MEMHTSLLPNMDSILLLAVMQDRAKRNELLLHKKLAISTEHSMKLRFCCAMEDFSKLEDVIAKKQKGLKIVSTFVVAGSLFQLVNIPLELSMELTKPVSTSLNNLTTNLQNLYGVVLEDLAKVPQIMQQVKLENSAPPAQFATAACEKGDDGDEENQDELRHLPRPVSMAQMRLNRADSLTIEFYDTIVSPKSRRKKSLLPQFRKTSSIMPSLSHEQKLLESAVADPVVRRNLVLKLATNNTEASIKVRLAQAINEYMEISQTHHKQEKVARGRKIVSTFIQPGSLFCVPGIPDHIFQALVGGGDDEYEMLIELRTVLFTELLQVQQVRVVVFQEIAD